MSAPAVPAGDLAPGQALPVEDVIARLAAAYKVDPERADSLRHSVTIAVLEEIRDGHQDPQGLAAKALLVMNTRFERGYPSEADEAAAIRQLMAEFPDGPELLLRAIHEEGVTDE